jgi:1-acyl-sn-glycerol-3-phosphate acyltransferase
MPSLAPLWKGLRTAEHLLTGAALAVVVATGQRLGYRIGWLDAVVRWWFRRLLHCLAVRVQADGVAAETALLVANHVSWLDIPVIGAHGNMRFLAKAEVRNWPLIGWMSELTGTVFIDRGANRVAAVVEWIATRIRAGQPMVVFPEGTTTDGRQVQRFHPRLFAICQQSGLAVQPVALRYGSGPEPDPVAPFVGDDTLAAHLWRLLRHPGLDVRVSFLTPISVADVDRRRLAGETRLAIATSLGLDGAEPLDRPRSVNRGQARTLGQGVQPGDVR